MSRTLVMLALSIALATGPRASHAAGSPAAPPGVLVSLSISGGLTYTGVLRSAPSSASSFCSLTTYARGKRAVYAAYEVGFHKAAPSKAFQRQFGLTVLHYRWGTLDYASPVDTLLDVTVLHQSYYGSRSFDPAYSIKVHVERNAMGGTFAARHVGSLLNIHRPPITVRGSWRCGRLATRTIQVQ